MKIDRFNVHNKRRNALMLHGPLAHLGYDWWWHSFTAQDIETGEHPCCYGDRSSLS